ncbi:MAG: hypothetical protein QNL12_11230 [Acidimicrobiia bacterium]|nr:hypothetical protein [Acidimicrobiia bacterium]MDX2467877.1 hypothetical protein [Acidimicrobiia bacterium]
MKWFAWMLAGALVTASCGGQTSPEAPVATGASTATTSTTVAAESNVVPTAVAPCDLVEIDEVSAVAELTVDEARNESPISCVFDFGEDAGVGIFLNVDDGEGRFGAPASLFENYMAMVPEGSAEVIPNLGAAAVYVQGFRGLAVDAGGGQFIGLGVNGGYGELAEPREVLIELAAIALGRL